MRAHFPPLPIAKKEEKTLTLPSPGVPGEGKRERHRVANPDIPRDANPLPSPQPARRHLGSDVPFVLALALIGGLYALLIVAMLLADVAFLRPSTSDSPAATHHGPATFSLPWPAGRRRRFGRRRSATR